MCMRFAGQKFRFPQPDGSSVELRGWGNQHHAVFETLDGYTVVTNPETGFFELAELSTDGERLEPVAGARTRPDGGRGMVSRTRLRVSGPAARASAQSSALPPGNRRCDERRRERESERRAFRAAAGGIHLAPPSRGTVGEYVGLTLLVDFGDSPATITRDEVERFCNQVGYSGFGNHGSVRDYFFDQSIGRCRYTNIVLPYYRAKFPKTHYTNPAIAYGQRAQELIHEALAFHKAQGVDFSGLTADGAGFVYALNVFYAGPNLNAWGKGLWAHASQLDSRVVLAPGKTARDYQFTHMGSELALGTFCHENGHMLCDYPDLYDYGDQSAGVGMFCLMCAGNHADQKNPTGVSAYLKRLAGWAGPLTALEHGKTVTLAATGNAMAMLAKSEDEYFLIENRQQGGRDAALPGAGLAIWHVDERGDNQHEGRTAALHYELSLEQADGLFQLEASRNESGDMGDLWSGAVKRFAHDTTPGSRWWDGTASHLVIDQISASGPLMSFRCSFDNVVDPPPGGGGGAGTILEKSSAPNRAVPDNDAAGIADTITVAEAVTIADLKVSVEIKHSWRGDLEVRLVAPWGEAIVLHPRTVGGDADDLRATFDAAAIPALAGWRGRSATGAWRLEVRDVAPADVGTLERWQIEITPQAAAHTVVLEESPGTAIPDAPAVGIERQLATTAAGNVGSVEVEVEILHSWIGDLRVALRSPAGTEVLLHDRRGDGDDNITTTYTAATTPALVGLAGQPTAGAWRLLVSDHEARDVGKLKRWRLTLKP